MSRHPGHAVQTPAYASDRPADVAAQLWAYRELFLSMVVRDLKVKYQRSWFGLVWTLFNPAATALILITVFSFVVRIPIPHYWAFLLSGYFAWNFVSQVVSSGTLLMDQHAGLSRSVRFPAEILVFSGAVSRLIEFLIELAIVVALLALFHHGHLPGSLLLLPVLALIQLLLALGLTMPVVALSVFYYDVRLFIPMLLMMLFYASPVFYRVDMVPEAVRGLYLFNPLAPLLTLYQDILHGGRFPGVAELAFTAALGTALFLVGYAIFNRAKPSFAELV